MIVVLNEEFECGSYSNIVDRYDDLRYCINDISEIKFDRVDDEYVSLLSEDGWIGVKIVDIDEIKRV